MEKEKIKTCTSCNKIPEIQEHHIDGSVYCNLICACKRTPLERSSMGANTHEWNIKWFNTDPETVNKKARWKSKDPWEKFHYYM